MIDDAGIAPLYDKRDLVKMNLLSISPGKVPAKTDIPVGGTKSSSGNISFQGLLNKGAQAFQPVLPETLNVTSLGKSAFLSSQISLVEPPPEGAEAVITPELFPIVAVEPPLQSEELIVPPVTEVSTPEDLLGVEITNPSETLGGNPLPMPLTLPIIGTPPTSEPLTMVKIAATAAVEVSEVGLSTIGIPVPAMRSTATGLVGIPLKEVENLVVSGNSTFKNLAAFDQKVMEQPMQVVSKNQDPNQELFKGVTGTNVLDGKLNSLLAKIKSPSVDASKSEGMVSAVESASEEALTRVQDLKVVRGADPLGQTRMVMSQISDALVRVGFKVGERTVINLSPEELGRVEVTLQKIEGSHAVRVVVDKVETLDIIKNDIRLLEKSLIEAGMDLGQGSVDVTLRQSADSADNGDIENLDGVPEIKQSRDHSGPRRLEEGRGTKLNITV